MTKRILKNVNLMVETVVELVSIHIIALIVLVTVRSVEMKSITLKLEMVSVTMKLTTPIAVMTVETVVLEILLKFSVLNVNVIVKVLNLLVMASVIMKQTLLNATMMVEIVVDLLYLVSRIVFQQELFQDVFVISGVIQNIHRLNNKPCCHSYGVQYTVVPLYSLHANVVIRVWLGCETYDFQ